MSVSFDETEVVQKVHEAVDENLLLLLEKDDQIIEENNEETKAAAGYNNDAPVYFRY